jgi:hypothetical protein
VSDQDPSEIWFNKNELLRRIQVSFAALEKTIQSLDPDELSQPGPSGWAVKDHLAHLAAWELGIAELLQRRDRFSAMGISEAVELGLSEDEINKRLFQQHAGLTPEEARELLYDAHNRLLQALEPLSDEDLRLPYAAYLPESAPGGPQEPVWGWIVGNTYDHFDEHRATISRS